MKLWVKNIISQVYGIMKYISHLLWARHYAMQNSSCVISVNSHSNPVFIDKETETPKQVKQLVPVTQLMNHTLDLNPEVCVLFLTKVHGLGQQLWGSSVLKLGLQVYLTCQLGLQDLI